MPKFNEFIKDFEEKETATKPQEPQVETPKVETAPNVEGQERVKGTTQTPARTFKPLSKAEAEDMRKGGYTEDEYRYKQAKDYAIAMGEQMPDKRKFMQELGEWKEANKQKAEDPNSLEYEGYRLERTPDGKWINRDTYEYFDTKVEAQKDIDKFISAQVPNKPKEAEKPAPRKDDEKGQRIVNYGGKDMTFDEAKALYKKAVAIPTLKSTPEREAYLDKSAEYDIAQDELYKKWYEEKDPQKKAELKEQMDTLDKEYARFLNEWEEAERNRYKKD